MRTLALGDIHGCFRSLNALEAFVDFKPDDRIIALGDNVDRGPDSRQVIEWLIERLSTGKLIALRGNHELMMLAARQDEAHLDEWLSVGGKAVLSSYGTQCLDDIPKPHWDFLAKSLRAYYATQTHFFVHANAYAEYAMEDQPPYMLYWESFGNPSPHESGKVMVCGHTPQRSGVPLNLGHAICIDSGAYRGGWLTCLDVDAGVCFQANEAGKTRRFWLDEGP